ncbi:M20/M25/M40 family metallo-hydrolase [Bacillus fonticola]|uniref:M20/M25/M40 family metallo-hydrolase n=1 Tax=Bacillus fonticola TaxID=2728853 RepID=UPI001474B5CA|nr:M20/M25/M40 family metallo-hydrolase [Bacillus fonticola]
MQYDQLHTLSDEERAELLTKTLVSQQSYNGTEGERAKAQWLYDFLQSVPYFRQHPDQLWLQDIREDPFFRQNVWVYVPATSPTKKTVLFHAHIDTVGTEDYGAIQQIAHQPDKLLPYFQEKIPEGEIRTEALSGDWLFGRGSLDMQSGIAVHLVNLLHYIELEERPCNLLWLFNPDEEAEHAGIKAAGEELLRLQEGFGLDYSLAVNDDFITSLYEGDTSKIIYTGTAGKVFPSFFIAGREAHVGDAFTAIDPTMISSWLNVKLNMHPDHQEEVDGEYVIPPTVLFQRDTKEQYNVQTPLSAGISLNVFLYEQQIGRVVEHLKRVAIEVVADVEQTLRSRYRADCDKKGFPARDLSWKLKVQTYEEFERELTSRGVPVQQIIEDVLQSKTPEEDSRKVSFRIVQTLQHHDPNTEPRVVLYFAPPYLPNHEIHDESTLEAIGRALDTFGSEEIFKVKRFFPFLSDSSFLAFHGNEEDVERLTKNFPAMDTLFPLPIKAMSALAIPSINVGVYGKDGHKWTERVYKPYSFGVVPKLIRHIVSRVVK